MSGYVVHYRHSTTPRPPARREWTSVIPLRTMGDVLELLGLLGPDFVRRCVTRVERVA